MNTKATASITYKTPTFAEILEEMIESSILEAAQHFEKSKSSKIYDDARYLYNKRELDSFLRIFKGDRKTLRVNMVYNDNGDFLCYEVCRKNLYERATKDNLAIYYGEEQVAI